MLENPQYFLFFFFSTLLIMSALFVVLNPNILNSALFLVLFFLSLAGIFALMNSVLLATLQVLVYAGAIMVLIVFVIMLISETERTFDIFSGNLFRKCVIFFIFLSFILTLSYHFYFMSFENISDIFFKIPDTYEYTIEGTSKKTLTSNTAVVGAFMFLEYLIPFELICFLLITAMVGVVCLAQTKKVNKL